MSRQKESFFGIIGIKSAALAASFAAAGFIALIASPGPSSGVKPPATSAPSSPYTEAIYSALKNTSSDVRLRALEIIRERPSAFSAARVSPLLGDSDMNVKIQAAKTLAALGDRSGAPVLRTMAFTLPKVSASPSVAERVRHFTAQNNRIKAIAALGEIKDAASVDRLQEATADSDARVADAAWMSLARMGNRKGAEIFISGLKNSEKAVRAKSAQVVGEIGLTDALPLLRERLSDWDKDVKISAVRALGALGDAASAVKLREMVLSDKDTGVREAAVRALGEIKDAETPAFLKKFVNDENPAVRLAVCEALAKSGDYSGRDFVEALAERGAEKEARRMAVASMIYFAPTPADDRILGAMAGDEDTLTALEAVRVMAFRPARKVK